MRRIYLEIYASVVGAALLVAAGVALFGHWYFEGRLDAQRAVLRETGARIVAELPAGAPPEALDAALAELAARYRISAVMRSADGEVMATAGPDARPGRSPGAPAGPPRRPGAAPPSHPLHPAGRHARGDGPPPWAWTSVDLPDGGVLELVSTDARRPPRFGPWWFGALFLGTVAVAAYPVSRRITRGLEKLREGVSELGEGDLGARVEIEGRNEVADVARAFNVAAAKIQRSVESQRRMLASASHELRSPLGRLRAAVELLAEGRGEHLAEAERDIAELDGLIEDLLLAARLEGAAPAVRGEPVDLAGIVHEEAARVGAACAGEAAPLRGDPRMLRRLVRNLLENAARHGAPPISIRLEPGTDPGTLALRVSDAGPGVAPAERERIFEPFYRAPGHSEARDGGVGLGLALVAEIAAHHGGRVRCVDDGAGSSAFVVELPLDRPEGATRPA